MKHQVSIVIRSFNSKILIVPLLQPLSLMITVEDYGHFKTERAFMIQK